MSKRGNADGYGIVLPQGQIIPTDKEAWAWHEVSARQIIQEFDNANPCCDELSVECKCKYFIGDFSGKYRKQENDYNNKALYKHEGGTWCIFHGGEDIHGEHWKVDFCYVVEEGYNMPLGWGWRKIEAECPEDIGPNWRYHWSCTGLLLPQLILVL